MPDVSLEDRFVGCMLGLAIGDALGAPFEGQVLDEMQRKYKSAADLFDNPPPGCLWYTDDTQMAIGVAETLQLEAQVDEDQLRKRFVANFEPHRGYGRGARLILEAMIAGHDYKYLANNLFPGGSFGNGAAMRVAPVGLFFRDDHNAAWEQARLQSLLTHVHPLGIEGAQVIALAVSLASTLDELDRPSFFSSIATRCASLEFSGPLGRAAKLDDLRDLGLFGNGIEAASSVVTAVASFGFTPNSFVDTVGNVILLGGDTDTLAAMAGAISGAYLGVSAIPEHLLEKLEDQEQGRSFIERLARQLYQTYEAAQT